MRARSTKYNYGVPPVIVTSKDGKATTTQYRQTCDIYANVLYTILFNFLIVFYFELVRKIKCLSVFNNTKNSLLIFMIRRLFFMKIID